ncbi:hypothetical protein [Amycolatopsis anabasis]|uniref:hypothetical protein n=1 Tax=Amycolatopsis anabasis TaxID=1840409 RepID=UPI00131D4939|nr:hypothetical protein [Amycolatopsis anabasis]
MPATSTTRLRWLVPALIVVLSLTVGGGLLARELYRQPVEELGTADELPTSSSLAPEQQPGDPTVKLSADAVLHPHDEDVRDLLQNFFDAINHRNFEQWRDTVTRERLQSRTQSQWEREYETTRDGSIVVHRIEAVGPSALHVLVTFTSTQNVKYAPPELPEGCIRWRLVLPVVQESGRWRVDQVLPGTTPEHEKC